MTEKTLDVTGQWDGQFSYPHALPPEFFSASLFEAGGRLGGTVTERVAGGQGDTCFISTVRGIRYGASVRFTKTYEGSGRQHAVLYTGTLNADGTEIEGEWRIAGSWSGRFLMLRRSGGNAATVRQAEAALTD
ncbi:hypothetical protein D3W54_07840 [Komagataeibacter medellinensis]|uniref:DUF1579 domain-containing protein n=1 Tax=Komagataeibacter medellinensis TaxID=1177712 RepID=A0ABQ6VVD4_9PROT|nr:hypothetical protein [Komagataeibacter medellinensis]KAB8124128.1 hypothetical protein D3W54_07840 [Komagataeibacter medellinensis]